MGRRSVLSKQKKRYMQKKKKKISKSTLVREKPSTPLWISNSPGSSANIPVASQSSSGLHLSSPLSSTYDPFGSPGSPPSSPLSNLDYCESSNDLKETPDSIENDSLIGIDSAALIYDLEHSQNFELVSGEYLKDSELLIHLKKHTDTLTNKVHFYQRKCESLTEQLDKFRKDSKDSISSIRHFYRNMLFYGSTQGAKMLKATYNRK